MIHIPFMIEGDRTVKIHASHKKDLASFKLLAYAPTGAPLLTEHFKGIWSLDENDIAELSEEDQKKLNSGEPFAMFVQDAIQTPEGNLNLLEIYSKLEDAGKFGLVIKLSKAKKLV